jgi:integrase/recombinase XerD
MALPDDWSCWMRAEGMAERTISERTRIVACAGRYAGMDPSMLSTRQLVAYLANQPSAATRQTYYGALRAWHRWLAETGQRPDDPTLGVRRPRAPRRRPKPVATTHLEKLLASGIRGRTRAAVLLCAMQGLRVHEAAKMRGEDIDLEADTLRVVGKGGVDETIPLHPDVAAVASDFPRAGFWFPSYAHPDRPVRRESLSAVISRAMKRAGVPGTAHSLRHWHATELVRSGVNVRVVQTLMRHSSLATTALYVQVDQDQQRAALALLPHPHDANRRTVRSS